MCIYHNLAPRCALAALLLALVSAFGSTAHAATLSINPLRIELDARHRTDVINLKNTAESPLRLQVRTMVWTMADDGQWQLTPSKDLIVTPELVEVHRVRVWSCVSGSSRIAVRWGGSIPVAAR